MPLGLDKLCLLLNIEQCNAEYRREIINISMLFCLNFNKWMGSLEIVKQFVCAARLFNNLVNLTLVNFLQLHVSLVQAAHEGHLLQISFEEASLKKEKQKLEKLVTGRTIAQLRFAADMTVKASANDSMFCLSYHHEPALKY